jgi:4-hydroxybenzoate polyprenyltransferase
MDLTYSKPYWIAYFRLSTLFYSYTHSHYQIKSSGLKKTKLTNLNAQYQEVSTIQRVILTTNVGMVTVKGAAVRLVVFNVIYIIMGAMKGVALLTLMWQLATTLGHFGGGHKNGIVKNFLNSVAGIIPQLASAWIIMYGSIPSHIFNWVVYVAWIMFFLLPIQELRDVPGDQVLGRKTLPLLFGENFTRVLLVVICMIMPAFLFYVCTFSEKPLLPSYGAPFDHLFVGFLSVWLWYLAFRIYKYRTKEKDHASYMLLSWWYAALLAGTIVLAG